MTLPRLAFAAPLAAALIAGSAAAQQPVPAPVGSADAYALPATPAPAPISAREFAERRRALAAAMSDGVLVALGEVESDAPFAQNSPFRWLTGVDEPGATLVISKRGGAVSERLYVPARNPAREVWDGPRLGAEGALRLTGIPSSTADSLDAQLQPLLSTATTLYTLAPVGSDGSRARFLRPDQQFIQQLRARYPNLTQVRDVSAAAFGLRATKSTAELDMIRRAVYITALAQREAMRATEPGMNEFEVHALIEGTFRRYGAERPGFGSIVGSGPNSTTLHYRAADRFMRAGEMLVMDIGASYNGYTADLTRSIPVTGRFTPEQREIYSIVLEAQKAAEREARPGVPLGALQGAAIRVLGAGMTRLGLIEAPDAVYDCDQGGRRTECPQGQLFFMHGIGHGIGLDVHDPEASYPNYGGGFRVGSAFTIEPGIYVRGDALDYLVDTPRNRALRARLAPVIARYRDIGVRIEDDYFMGPAGLERVSAGAPREIAEIEAQMALDSGWNRERRPEVVEWYRGISPATP